MQQPRKQSQQMLLKLFNLLSIALLINILAKVSVQQVFENDHLGELQDIPTVVSFMSFPYF